MKKVTTIAIDDELRKEAKIKCIIEGISFPKYVELLIKADLEKQKKNECA